MFKNIDKLNPLISFEALKMIKETLLDTRSAIERAKHMNVPTLSLSQISLFSSFLFHLLVLGD